MPTSMRCVVLQSFGEQPKILTRGERPVPEPGPGQARIRMAMSPIYNHDLAIVHGGVRIPTDAPGRARNRVDRRDRLWGTTHRSAGSANG